MSFIANISQWKPSGICEVERGIQCYWHELRHTRGLLSNPKGRWNIIVSRAVGRGAGVDCEWVAYASHSSENMIQSEQIFKCEQLYRAVSGE